MFFNRSNNAYPPAEERKSFKPIFDAFIPLFAYIKVKNVVNLIIFEENGHEIEI